MQRYTIFMNQKYTILLNVNSPQINLQIQHCPNKNDRGFFVDIAKLIIKFI